LRTAWHSALRADGRPLPEIENYLYGKSRYMEMHVKLLAKVNSNKDINLKKHLLKRYYPFPYLKYLDISIYLDFPYK
jgi:hypothetical protein